jgi:hypothetical protein
VADFVCEATVVIRSGSSCCITGAIIRGGPEAAGIGAVSEDTVDEVYRATEDARGAAAPLATPFEVDPDDIKKPPRYLRKRYFFPLGELQK